MNVSDKGEFPAAALRARSMRGARFPDTAFTDAVFVNRNKHDHAALEQRVSAAVAAGRSQVPRNRIEIRRDDANTAIRAIVGRFPRRDYLFVFADLEAPRPWPWASVEALLAQGHSSVDLYMLFPLEMGITRLCGYSKDERERYGTILSRFFG